MMKFQRSTFIVLFIILFSHSVLSQERPGSFADLTEKLMPAVVNISTTTTIVTKTNPLPNFQFPPGSPFEDMFKEFGTPQKRKSSAKGSGFIIDKKGIVITNNHVIQDAEDIFIRTNENKEYKAKILGTDPLSDIAVLEIITDDKFDTVKFGDSDTARIGDWVIAIGNPFGLGGTVTSGIVSARNRNIGMSRYEDFIQTDASINTGNSGGPLFNMKGEVIGINTAILSQSGSIGIGFAIPSNNAKLVINQLLEFGETKRGWLGVRIQTVTKEIAEVEKLKKARGALVASVAPGSPSDKAGIKDGDIILEFDGKKINEMQELPLIVAQTKVGKVVNVKVWRNKKEITKKITLGRLETSEDFRAEKPTKPKTTFIDGLKIEVRKITRDDLVEKKIPLNTTGVVITKIDTESPINYLKVGDLIVEAQKRNIKSATELNNLVNAALKTSSKTILIAVINDQNQKRYIGVKLK